MQLKLLHDIPYLFVGANKIRTGFAVRRDQPFSERPEVKLNLNPFLAPRRVLPLVPHQKFVACTSTSTSHLKLPSAPCFAIRNPALNPTSKPTLSLFAPSPPLQ